MARFRVNSVERGVVPYQAPGGALTQCLIELVHEGHEAASEGQVAILTMSIMCVGESTLKEGDCVEIELRRCVE